MSNLEEARQFQTLLEGQEGLTKEAIDRVVRYRDRVVEENTRQNLTRLVSPAQFLEGHVLDSLEINRLGRMGRVLDLGSGAGVPGLLCAALGSGNTWILAESEKRKAEFLSATVEALGLQGQVEVFYGRAEEFLSRERVDAVIARAVGPVARIFRWLQGCSTWNKLILLKGPAWEEEWAEFQKTADRKKLLVQSEHAYMVGAERKQRKILILSRTGSH